MRPGAVPRPLFPATPSARGVPLFGWWQADAGGPSGTNVFTDVTSEPTRITTMNDRAGSGHTLARFNGVVAGCPTWNGVCQATQSVPRPVKRPEWYFDGTPAIEVSPGPNLTDWTISFRATPQAFSWLFGFNFSSNTGIGMFSDGIHVKDGVSSQLIVGNALNLGQQYSVVVTKSGNTVTAYCNGLVGSATMVGANLQIGSTSTSFLVGADGVGSTFQGWLSEFVLYTGALSATQAATEISYLGNPGAAPLKSAGTNVLVFIGNSLAVGVTASEELGTRVASLLSNPNYQLVQLGISGQTTTTMLSNILAEAGAKAQVTDRVGSGSQTYVFVQEIINDLQAVQVPATVLSTYQTYCADIRSYGAITLAQTPTGMTGEGTAARYANFETDRQSIASLMRLAALGTYWDYLIDDAGNTSIGPAPPITGNTWYTSEGTAPNRQCWHWNNTGQLVAANLRIVALATFGIS